MSKKTASLLTFQAASQQPRKMSFRLTVTALNCPTCATTKVIVSVQHVGSQSRQDKLSSAARNDARSPKSLYFRKALIL
jgi:hypothetical protein